MERIRETARRAIIGDEVLPVCEICPKINSRTFESEDERRKHTAVEFYETYLGEDYEKQRAAVAEVAVSSKYRSDYLSAMKKITNSFWDEINRLYTACKYCRQCYRECVSDPTQTRGEKCWISLRQNGLCFLTQGYFFKPMNVTLICFERL